MTPDSRFLLVRDRLTESNDPKMTQFLIEEGIAVLGSSKLTQPLKAQASLARQLIELTPEGSPTEAHLLVIWKNAHIAWAKDGTISKHKIKNQLTRDTADRDSRFAKTASDTRWEITKLQFLAILERVTLRKGPEAAAKLVAQESRYGQFLNPPESSPSP